MNEETKNTETTQNTMPIGVILGVLAVCAVVAGGIFWFTSGDRTMSANEAADPFGAEEAETGADTPALATLPDVVAEVNGVAIPKEELEGTIAQLGGMYAQQGANPSDPAIAAEIQAQALESVINTEILTQAAVAAGSSVDDGAVEAELASVRARFADEETFLAELGNAGVTLDQFRADIKEQLTVNEYVTNTEQFISIPAVTEEEARAFYEESAAQATGEVPSFEEVRPQVEAQLTQQKQQEAVAELLEELRAAATIDVKI